mmetsp:Transcript_37526/g.110913  ORF Transcript_37526/g.110913 Transcript_37526/m.110913 type:complete len:207 (-) Transcript_37526:127-747(-)
MRDPASTFTPSPREQLLSSGVGAERSECTEFPMRRVFLKSRPSRFQAALPGGCVCSRGSRKGCAVGRRNFRKRTRVRGGGGCAAAVARLLPLVHPRCCARALPPCCAHGRRRCPGLACVPLPSPLAHTPKWWKPEEPRTRRPQRCAFACAQRAARRYASRQTARLGSAGDAAAATAAVPHRPWRERRVASRRAMCFASRSRRGMPD